MSESSPLLNPALSSTAAPHSRCDSGDNTIESLRRSIIEITKEEADDHIVFLVSDANLDQYSITSETFRELFKMDPRVSVFVVLIASIGDQATKLEQQLPPGKVTTCLDKAMLPKTMKQFLLSQALSRV